MVNILKIKTVLNVTDLSSLIIGVFIYVQKKLLHASLANVVPIIFSASATNPIVDK